LGDFSNPIGSRLGVWVRHLESGSEGTDRIGEAGVIDCDRDAIGSLRKRRRAVGMLQDRQTGLGKEEFFRETSRC
jgi:hypothetical protein